MAWQSKTRQFNANETAMLERMTAEQLAGALLNSMNVVALRALAEVMLNNDETKLSALLANEALTAHWRGYHMSPFVDMRDDQYARQLEEKLQLNTPA